jgi:HAD domain in Swiss Army Knife RNA repair proteins
MKVIFLDIDGVLNKEGTKERIEVECPDGSLANGAIGIDAKLRDLLLGWLATHPEVKIVLSSTWRYLSETRAELEKNGIFWIAETPSPSQLKGLYRAGIRGEEIQDVLDTFEETDKGIEAYAILDDMGPYQFLQHQRQFLVQTSERWGLQQKHLDMLDRILG